MLSTCCPVLPAFPTWTAIVTPSICRLKVPGSPAGSNTLFTVRRGGPRLVIVQVLLSPCARLTVATAPLTRPAPQLMEVVYVLRAVGGTATSPTVEEPTDMTRGPVLPPLPTLVAFGTLLTSRLNRPGSPGGSKTLFTVSRGSGGGVDEPLTAIVLARRAGVLVTVSVAAKVPVEVGWNATGTARDVPAASTKDEKLTG